MKTNHKILSLFLCILLLVPLVPVPSHAVNGGLLTEVASLEHDTIQGEHNSFLQIDSDTYVLAYDSSSPNGDGVITTFTISADGTTITEIASLEHDTVSAQYNSLVQVDSDTYALAYSGSGSDGYITTFTIPSDGSTITERAAGELEHDTDRGQRNSLVQVDSDTYALAYEGTDGDGFITTFTISADGNTITERAAGELEHDTDTGSRNSLVQVDSDTYALAYTGAGNTGYITTFTISADGNTITERVADALQHDATFGFANSLVQVDSDTYALAYSGSGSDGHITTFTISADGNTITE